MLISFSGTFSFKVAKAKIRFFALCSSALISSKTFQKSQKMREKGKYLDLKGLTLYRTSIYDGGILDFRSELLYRYLFPGFSSSRSVSTIFLLICVTARRTTDLPSPTP